MSLEDTLSNSQTIAIQAIARSAKNRTKTYEGDTVTVMDIPAQMSAPTVDAVTGVNGTQLSVTHAALPSDNGSPITRVDMRHSPAGAGTWTVVQDIDFADEIIDSLAADTSFDVQTRAVNIVDDNPSNWSASTTVSTTVAAPTRTGVNVSQQDLFKRVAVGSDIDYTVMFSGDDITYSVSLTTGSSLPDGLTLNASTGVTPSTDAPTLKTVTGEPVVVYITATNNGGSVTDTVGVTFTVSGPLLAIGAITQDDVTVQTDDPDDTGTIYWAFCTILNPAEDDLIAGSGTGIEVAGNFASDDPGDTMDLTSQIDVDGYWCAIQVGGANSAYANGARSNMVVQALPTIQAVAAFTLLQTYFTSTDASLHETAPFTPTGGKPLVVFVSSMNGVSASAPAAVNSADIGAAARATGDGTDPSNSVTDDQSRTNAWIYVWPDPGSSEITFEMQFAGTQRAVIIEVWEYEGNASVQNGQKVATSAGSVSSRSPSLSGAASNSVIAHLAAITFESLTIDWSGVTVQGVNRDSNAGGSSTADCTMRTARKDPTIANPHVATANFGATANAAVALSMEILQ